MQTQADSLQTQESLKLDQTQDFTMEEEKSKKREREEDVSSADVSCSETEIHKKKRRRIDRTPKEGTFLRFTNLNEEDRNDLMKQIEEQDYGVTVQYIPNLLIRLYPSEAEAKKERKEYRKRYNQLPEIVEKRREKSKNPKEIEKRQKNNENEEVKKRKQECATGRRKTLKELKELIPDLYEATYSKNVPPLPPKSRKTKKVPSEQSTL